MTACPAVQGKEKDLHTQVKKYFYQEMGSTAHVLLKTAISYQFFLVLVQFTVRSVILRLERITRSETF